METRRNCCLCNIALILFIGFISIKPVKMRSIPTTSDYGEDSTTPRSAAEVLTDHGLSRSQIMDINARIAELKDIRENMTAADKAWLDNILPNIENEEDFFDGCSWMTPAQLDFIVNMIKDRLETTEEDEEETAEARSQKAVHSRRRRKVKDFDSVPKEKWHNPIFYKLDRKYNADEKAIINSAFRHWQEQTCLRFFEVNERAYIPFAHVLVTNVFYGCMSFVGRVNNKGQILNLHGICLKKFGIPVHEIGHVLGLWHEHQRWDRDDYIRTVEANIGGYRAQFWRQKTTSYNVPYDYGSVMHYGAKTGSVTGKNTLETLDPLYQNSIGQRTGLSFFDAKAINMAYCKGTCQLPLLYPCQRGGYQDPNDCGRCRCPDGFGGTYCDEVAHSASDCGGVVELSKEGTTITSPGYKSPTFYDDRVECNWMIKAPKHHRILMTFEGDFGLYCANRGACYHWVEVKYKGDLSRPGPRFCCYEVPSAALLSDGPEAVVTLRANYSTYWTTVRRGFQIRLRAVPFEGIKKDVESRETEKIEVKDPHGTTWSDWGRCQNNECKCGGCSTAKRYRMCGIKRCTGDLAATQSRICDRVCKKADRYLNLSGNIIEMPCPTCCSGFRREGQTCVSISEKHNSFSR